MEIIQGTTDIRLDFPTAVTLGKFDGLHLGHQKLIRALQQMCELGEKTVVFTFDIPTAAILERQSQPPVLMTREEKRRLLEQLGVDVLVEFPFTEETRRMSGEQFVRELLCHRLRMRAMAVGPDCRFGWQRSGDVELLQTLSAELGYALQVVEKERIPAVGEIVSSSRVKAEIVAGNMQEAKRLLGYPYRMTVKRSADRREIGIPIVRADGVWSAAQGYGEYKLVPPEGEYDIRIECGGDEINGRACVQYITDLEGRLIVRPQREISALEWQKEPKFSIIYN